MSDLNGFDGVFQISENFLIKLTTVIENKFSEAIKQGDVLCADTDPVDRAIEAVANRMLLVPRMLFATRNPAYPAGAGATLDQRLIAHRNLGDLDGPVFGGQPNRLVLLRDKFYTLDSPPTIDFETNQVRIPISGKAFLGRRFRTRADSTPGGINEGTFSVDLIYSVQVVDQPDKGLSFQRFQSVVDHLGARAAGQATLPQCKMQVYALNAGTRREPQWFLPPAGTSEDDLRSAGFTGQIGDELFERESDLTSSTARFQVEEREVLLAGGNRSLRMFLVDKDGPVSNHGGTQCEPGLPTDVAAKVLQGRISLVFERIEHLNINIPGQSFAGSEAVIEQSLVNLNPFGPASSDLSGRIPTDLFAQLEVQGKHGLDQPLFPKVFPLSFDAEIKPGETFVSSSAQAITFTATRVIANDALVLGGTLSASGGNIAAVPSLLNLSGGGRADTVTALSQRFFHDVFLDKLEAMINQKLLEKPEIDAVASINALFGDGGRIEVVASGSGTAEDAILGFIDVGFDFSLNFPIRLRLQNAIARDRFMHEVTGEDGTTSMQPVRLPVDAWGEPIPEWVFLPTSQGGLGIQPPAFETSDPNINPVCFLGFCDPDKHVPPELYCAEPIEAHPPVRYNADGTQRAPGPEEDRSIECHRQSDFSSTSQLTHAQEIGFIWPTEDEVKFDADADFGIIGWILIALIAVVVSAFSFGIGGALLGAGMVAAALIATGVMLGLTITGVVIAIIAEVDVTILMGDKVSGKVAEALASITLTLNPSFDLHIGLASYVVDTTTQSDADQDLGALINRSRLVVETQDDRTGLEGFLDEC